MPETQEYHAYVIGSDGQIKKRFDLICADKEAAKQSAKQLVNGEDVELWQRDRKIAAFSHKPSQTEQALASR